MNEKQLELIEVPFSAFLKIEMPRFAERMIEIVETHNPEKLAIKKMYDLLVAEKLKIEKLTDKFGAHPLTKTIVELREMRSLRISAIRLRLKVVLKESKKHDYNQLQTVKSEINHFLKNLQLSKNDDMYSQKITQFLALVASTPKLEEALDSLSFSEPLNDLKEVHQAIDKLIYSRLVSISNRPKETTAQLTKSVLTAIKNMIKQIEIAPLLNEDIDYKPLFGELNQFFGDYKNMINKRLLFNKKKANKADSHASSELTIVTDTAPIEEFAKKIQDDSAKEENAKQLNTQPAGKEKTAAMASKAMHLPIVSDTQIDTTAHDKEVENKCALEDG